MTDVAVQIVAKAQAAGVTITTAESCTGGLVSAALTDIPGSSAVFERGFVTYSNDAKIEMIGVPPAILDQHGAVSEPVAHAMAKGAQLAAGANIAVALSGVAGPGGSPAKPEGMVCFALAHGSVIQTETRHFGPIGRKNVRIGAKDHALALILGVLKTG